MIVGKVLTGFFVMLGVLLAALTDRFPSIFGYMQTMRSIFQGPLFAIIALGLLWARATGIGTVAGILFGVATSGMLFWVRNSVFTCPDPFLYITWWAFLARLAATATVSLMSEPEPPEKIEGLVFRRFQKTNEVPS